MPAAKATNKINSAATTRTSTGQIIPDNVLVWPHDQKARALDLHQEPVGRTCHDKLGDFFRYSVSIHPPEDVVFEVQGRLRREGADPREEAGAESATTAEVATDGAA